MLRFFVFAALLAVSSAQFQDSCPDDTYAKITQCYVNYFAGYNISMTWPIPEYWSFHGVRRQLLDDDGLHIQPYVCQLGNTLVNCLSPYTCMGPNAYMKMGAYNASEAIDYQIDLAVTNYQCGVGYNLTMTEFYCMAFCRDRYQPNLDACDAQVPIDVKKGMNQCAATQKDWNCQSAIYSQCCDFNAGVYICNVNLAGLSSVDPTCANAGQVSCPAPR